MGQLMYQLTKHTPFQINLFGPRQAHGLSGVLYSSGGLYNSPTRDVCCLQ